MDPKKKKAKFGESGFSTLETSVLEHIFSGLDKRSGISLSHRCKTCWFTWVSLKKHFRLSSIINNLLIVGISIDLLVLLFVTICRKVGLIFSLFLLVYTCFSLFSSPNLYSWFCFCNVSTDSGQPNSIWMS